MPSFPRNRLRVLARAYPPQFPPGTRPLFAGRLGFCHLPLEQRGSHCLRHRETWSPNHNLTVPTPPGASLSWRWPTVWSFPFPRTRFWAAQSSSAGATVWSLWLSFSHNTNLNFSCPAGVRWPLSDPSSRTCARPAATISTPTTVAICALVFAGYFSRHCQAFAQRVPSTPATLHCAPPTISEVHPVPTGLRQNWTSCSSGDDLVCPHSPSSHPAVPSPARCPSTTASGANRLHAPASTHAHNGSSTPSPASTHTQR